MTERWHQVPRDVLEQALELIASMQKHEEVTALKRHVESLEFEIKFLREHIQNLVNQNKEKE